MLKKWMQNLVGNLELQKKLNVVFQPESETNRLGEPFEQSTPENYYHHQFYQLAY